MKAIVIGLAIFGVLVTPTAAMATVLDLSGETYQDNTPPPVHNSQPNYNPGQGPGFQDIPSPSRQNDDFSSQPSQLRNNELTVDEALDQMDPFCRKIVNLQQSGQLEEYMSQLDMSSALSDLGKLFTCLNQAESLANQ